MSKRTGPESESGHLDLSGCRLAYRIYRHAENTSGRRLLLIHGAGVAGRYTWETLQSFLNGWSEILVPDLRGAGDTRSLDGVEHPFSVHQLVDDISALLNHLNWQRFDLGGYSLGGLVSMLLKQRLRTQVEKQYLLESAALDRLEWHETLAVRQKFAQAAEVLHRAEPEQGIRQFLDTISPNRKVTPQVEQLTIDRLGERARGFAHSLEAVTTIMQTLDREQLVAAQGDISSFIGGLSVEPMHQLHQMLAERMPNWHYFIVAGTDHSLPYQKPRQIAALMNRELARYLNTHCE